MTADSPNTRLRAEVGVVTRVQRTRPGAQELLVRISDREEPAINYPDLLGDVQPGERLLLNTTAVRAGLGTGGYHFAMRREEGREKPRQARGHIVKLRYTPLQFTCATVEEQDSRHREAIEACEGLDDMPVIVASLHSHLAPAAAAAKALLPDVTIAYIMTDTAALPLGFSQLVPALKESGLLDTTITVGQAFGGDLEAVNVYTGLLAARAVAGAAIAIIAQGPGNVGTETDWGFGSIAQGDQINAAAVLGGFPIAVPRVSFADPRPRHRGVSRQSLIALGRVALVQAVVAVPDMPPEKLEFVHRQLDDEGITAKHEVIVAKGEAGVEELAARNLAVKTMGRSPEQDPEFFLAAGAAGVIAAERLTWGES